MDQQLGSGGRELLEHFLVGGSEEAGEELILAEAEALKGVLSVVELGLDLWGMVRRSNFETKNQKH